MIEKDGIRVLEASDDPDDVGFEDSELPILRQDGGWWLRYRDPEDVEQEHLLTGELDDLEVAVHQARAWLDREPRTTAWPG